MIRKYIYLKFILIIFSSCTSLEIKKRQVADGIELNHEWRTSLSDYAYLESRTNHYNSDKILLQKEKDIETAQAVVKLNNARDVLYRLSPEEEIEKTAMKFVEDKKWEDAFAVLLKYEPILTYNKNIMNMSVLASFKLKKYDFAIQQLSLSLDLPDETLLDQKTRQDRDKILVHAYYLSGQEQLAESMYQNYLNKYNDSEISKVLSLIQEDKSQIDVVLNSSIDDYANKYIYSDYSKDAIIVREEFKPVTLPMRRPAGLELKKTK